MQRDDQDTGRTVPDLDGELLLLADTAEGVARLPGKMAVRNGSGMLYLTPSRLVWIQRPRLRVWLSLRARGGGPLPDERTDIPLASIDRVRVRHPRVFHPSLAVRLGTTSYQFWIGGNTPWWKGRFWTRYHLHVAEHWCSRIEELQASLAQEPPPQ